MATRTHLDDRPVERFKAELRRRGVSTKIRWRVPAGDLTATCFEIYRKGDIAAERVIVVEGPGEGAYRAYVELMPGQEPEQDAEDIAPGQERQDG